VGLRPGKLARSECWCSGFKDRQRLTDIGPNIGNFQLVWNDLNSAKLEDVAGRRKWRQGDLLGVYCRGPDLRP
jgi:hypothetical protein